MVWTPQCSKSFLVLNIVDIVVLQLPADLASDPIEQLINRLSWCAKPVWPQRKERFR